jgi:hypothetical protein
VANDDAVSVETIRGLTWGLDMSTDDVTPEEIERFREIDLMVAGYRQHGLEFMLHEHPAALKRYRAWADTLRIREPGEKTNYVVTNALGILVQYALWGNEEGLYYCLYGMGRGHTREQMLEVMALCFLWMGPRGMQEMARAAKMERRWEEPSVPVPVVWPEGWGPDPGAFKSGADFSTRDASEDDVQKILAWYERCLGEVPQHIQFMARWRPEVLKAYRHRYENILEILPKQLDPYLQIHLGVQRGQASVARDGILLARGFGMKRQHVIEALTWGAFYGGTPVLDYAEEAADGLLDDWPHG